MDAHPDYSHGIQNAHDAAYYHPELNANFLIYVKYAGVIYNQLANYQVSVRVDENVTIAEIADEVFARFGFEVPSLFLMTFKGRRLLELQATVGQIGLRADDVILIQWD